MLHVIRHHDEGWRDLDTRALRDPATGLPYNLVQTPFEHIVGHEPARHPISTVSITRIAA